MHVGLALDASTFEEREMLCLGSGIVFDTYAVTF